MSFPGNRGDDGTKALVAGSPGFLRRESHSSCLVLLSANITHASKTSWDPAAVSMMCYLLEHNKMLLCKSNRNLKIKFVISSTNIQGNNSQTTFKHF